MRGIIQDGIYKTWRTDKHILRMYNSFGISVSVLNDLRSKNIKSVEIIHKSSMGEKHYEADVSQFLNSPIETNFGDDPQKHIPIEKLHLIDGKQTHL